MNIIQSVLKPLSENNAALFFRGCLQRNKLQRLPNSEKRNTVQAEIEKLFTWCRVPFRYGSSRTDAGVHALQNYFPF
jgi:hypothetical protein